MNNYNEQTITNNLPIIVDLDGTLIKTDTLHEAIISLLKTNPLYIFLFLYWLIQGKAAFKQQIAKRITLQPELLPYNHNFLNYLREQHQQGRNLVLATGADKLYADKIASHLEIFDTVIASDGRKNLSGSQKLKAILEQYTNFVYAGNHTLDLKIWRASAAAIIISHSKRLLKKVAQLDIPIEYKNISSPYTLSNIIKALRIHQWTKNLLLFVPLFTAYKFMEWHLTLLAIKSFFALSLCASGVYMLNDLLDLTADRQHVNKKNRPFAAGNLPIRFGLCAIPTLFVISFLIAFTISLEFSAVIAIYLLLSISYSFYFKRIVLLDIVILATLYVIRVIGGVIAISVPLSEWLTAFSLFIFLSLALMKRASELYHLRDNNKLSTAGRGYLSSDFEQIASFGSASGYIAVLIFALYINSDTILKLYHQPKILWLCCPILLYWISRAWLLTHRGQMHDDPILFAIKDRTTYLVGLLILILLCLAK